MRFAHCPVCQRETLHQGACLDEIPRRFAQRLAAVAKAKKMTRHALVARILEIGLSGFEDDLAREAAFAQKLALARAHREGE
jgi:hypothetical protein